MPSNADGFTDAIAVTFGFRIGETVYLFTFPFSASDPGKYKNAKITYDKISDLATDGDKRFTVTLSCGKLTITFSGSNTSITADTTESSSVIHTFSGSTSFSYRGQAPVTAEDDEGSSDEEC